MAGSGNGSASTARGLGVLHLFCKRSPSLDVEAVVSARKSFLDAGGQLVASGVLGHKADVGLLCLCKDLWGLWRFQSCCEHAGLETVSSYVSLTEVSEYAQGIPERLREARLFPELPPQGMPVFGFYPMSKRRGSEHNWYMLDFDERRRLMVGHGAVGRQFKGRVLQLITGSTGLDDFEWGVTLFARHPDDLKACVYEMRFDEASALYAEFGPFYLGMVADLEEVLGEGPVV
ncbi:MAG: chlorite dismutase family protein [Acidimicrobiales bacterium]